MSGSASPPLHPDRATVRPRSALAWSALVTLAVFIGTAPTLGWLQFSSSMENLNVATVLEIRRTGHWWIPTLQGDARLNKPPLTAWVTTAFVPGSLVDSLDAHDSSTRESDYRTVAFRARLAPLLETCLTTLLIAAIAQITFGGATPFIAAAAYATSLLVLRLGRSATTDVQMMLWIASAHLGITLAIYRGRRWAGSVIAGVATGLALMSKGPVCLLFLYLPLIVMAVIRAVSNRGEKPAEQPRARWPIAPILLGVLLALIIGVPWYLMVYLKTPTVARGWTSEVTRIGATDNAKDNPAFYLMIFPFLTPWLPWAIVGMWQAIIEWRSRTTGDPSSLAKIPVARASEEGRSSAAESSNQIESGVFDSSRHGMQYLRNRMVYLLIGAVLPLVVMSFFPDRKDRYALPAMVPLSLLAAYGVEVCRATLSANRVRKALVFLHFITLAAVGLALPIAAAGWLRTATGVHWLSPVAAAGCVLLMVVLVATGWVLQRNRPLAFVGTTVAVMLSAQIIMMHGYSQSTAGLSDMKPLADQIRAAAPDIGKVINTRRDRKRISVDLSIYLNRSVEHVNDWPTLPPQNPPAIAIVQQFAGSAEPTPPPGWRAIGKTPRERDWMWAWIRE